MHHPALQIQMQIRYKSLTEAAAAQLLMPSARQLHITSACSNGPPPIIIISLRKCCFNACKMNTAPRYQQQQQQHDQKGAGEIRDGGYHYYYGSHDPYGDSLSAILASASSLIIRAMQAPLQPEVVQHGQAPSPQQQPITVTTIPSSSACAWERSVPHYASYCNRLQSSPNSTRPATHLMGSCHKYIICSPQFLLPICNINQCQCRSPSSTLLCMMWTSCVHRLLILYNKYKHKRKRKPFRMTRSSGIVINQVLNLNLTLTLILLLVKALQSRHHHARARARSFMYVIYHLI